jgi:hypothetical protein
MHDGAEEWLYFATTRAWVGLEPACFYSAGARGSGPDDGSDQGIRTI